MNNVMINKKTKFTIGFTLVELMVAISIFSLVMVISMGSIVTILDSNRKSQASRAVMDNLAFSLEGMTRTIRFGSNYNGGIDCSSGCPSLRVDFWDNQGAFPVLHGVTYSKSGSSIQKVDSYGGNTYKSVLTSTDVTIDSLTFYVLGAPPTPDIFQPRVVMVIKGKAGSSKSLTSFTLQTTVSQRKLDFQ